MNISVCIPLKWACLPHLEEVGEVLSEDNSQPFPTLNSFHPNNFIVGSNCLT